jgi:hypothetical protein
LVVSRESAEDIDSPNVNCLSLLDAAGGSEPKEYLAEDPPNEKGTLAGAAAAGDPPNEKRELAGAAAAGDPPNEKRELAGAAGAAD